MRRGSVWRRCWHRITQKVFLCKIVLLSVCVASINLCVVFFFVLFLDQSGEIGRVHLLASLLVEWQTDHSIMSTPGGVPGGLWAECSGYRTLAEEEEKEALSCFGLKHSEKCLPPGGRPAFNSCPFRNHPTFSAHVAQSQVSNQQKHCHTLHKNDDINRNRVCQQSFLQTPPKKKKERKKNHYSCEQYLLSG